MVRAAAESEVGGNAAALGVRARQRRATIGSRPSCLHGELRHGLKWQSKRSNHMFKPTAVSPVRIYHCCRAAAA